LISAILRSQWKKQCNALKVCGVLSMTPETLENAKSCNQENESCTEPHHCDMPIVGIFLSSLFVLVRASTID
jgi:hypothetical protein